MQDPCNKRLHLADFFAHEPEGPRCSLHPDLCTFEPGSFHSLDYALTHAPSDTHGHPAFNGHRHGGFFTCAGSL